MKIFFITILSTIIFISPSFSVDNHNVSLNSDLFSAIKSGDFELTVKLIENGADVNAKDNVNNTPIFTAVYFYKVNHNFEIIKLLIDKNADLNYLGRNGKSIVNFIIENYNNYTNEILKYFLDHGANVNQKYSDKTTPLINAIIWSKNEKSIDLVKFLIENGADINQYIEYKINCIKYFEGASTNYGFYNFKLTKYLIEQGMDVNIKDEFQNIPLDYAKNYDDFVYLIDKNSNINSVNNHGETPLHVLLLNYDKENESQLSLLAKVKLLIEAGAKSDYPDYKGITPKDIAYKSVLLDIINYFIKIDQNPVNNKTATLTVDLSGDITGQITINNKIKVKNGIPINLYPGEYKLFFQNKDCYSEKYFSIGENENLIINDLYYIQKDKETIASKNLFGFIGGLYLVGTILPVTNLLGFEYLYTFPLEYMVIETAIMIPSILFFSAAVSTFWAGGYKFFYEQENITFKSLFISSVICSSLSYFINLFYGLIIYGQFRALSVKNNNVKNESYFAKINIDASLDPFSYKAQISISFKL